MQSATELMSLFYIYMWCRIDCSRYPLLLLTSFARLPLSLSPSLPLPLSSQIRVDMPLPPTSLMPTIIEIGWGSLPCTIVASVGKIWCFPGWRLARCRWDLVARVCELLLGASGGGVRSGGRSRRQAAVIRIYPFYKALFALGRSRWCGRYSLSRISRWWRRWETTTCKCPLVISRAGRHGYHNGLV
jgi:hypothetical protein